MNKKRKEKSKRNPGIFSKSDVDNSSILVLEKIAFENNELSFMAKNLEKIKKENLEK